MPHHPVSRVLRAPRRALAATKRIPQWVRTVAVTVLMLGVAQGAALAYAPTVSLIPYSGFMVILMTVASGLAAHVAGSKTPPWRTVVWCTVVPFVVAAAAYHFTETRRTMELVAITWLLVLWLRLSGWGSHALARATAPLVGRWRRWREGRLLYNALSGGYIPGKYKVDISNPPQGVELDPTHWYGAGAAPAGATGVAHKGKAHARGKVGAARNASRVRKGRR